MKKEPIQTKTCWTIENAKNYARLDESFETDVCIIGGGLAGMLTAYLLQKAGKRVAVVEKSEIGAGVTELTTAFLTASIDTDFADLIKTFGPEKAQQIVDSHLSAIDLIESIAKEEEIECDFKRISNYLYAVTEKDFSIVDEECDAAQELGLNVRIEKDGSSLGFKNAGFMEMKDQAKFHPLKFLYGLADVIVERGAFIFERTEAEDILERDFGKSVRANGHSIQAKWVVTTTYEPFGEPVRLFFKKGMYKTYMLEAETEWKIPEGTYEDTENPYHYLRVDDAGTFYRLLIGGEDHRADIPVDETRCFNALAEYLERIIPKESFRLVRRWTGPILEPVDGLAFIGPLHTDEPVYYAFAFSGNGMTYSAIAAMLIAAYIEGVPHEWHELYRADRAPGLKALLVKGKDYSEELARGALKNIATEPKKPKRSLPKEEPKKKKSR